MSSTRSVALEEVAGGEDRQTRAEALRQRKARTTMVMGSVIGLLIIGLTFVAYNIYDIYGSSQAKVDYESAYDAYLTSVDQLDEALISVSDTLDGCRSSVADQSVCADLERSNAEGLELSNLRLDKADIHDKTTRAIREEIRLVQDKQSAVEQAKDALLASLDPVAQSQVDKIKVDIDAAIKDAEAAIAQAQKIIDETKDEVKDPKVHDSALDAIKALRAQIDGVKAVTGTDTAAYVAALNSLKQATELLRTRTNEVIASHELWDQERIEAEEQASAEAEASAREEEEADDEKEGEERPRRPHREHGD